VFTRAKDRNPTRGTWWSILTSWTAQQTISAPPILNSINSAACMLGSRFGDDTARHAAQNGRVKRGIMHQTQHSTDYRTAVPLMVCVALTRGVPV